LPLENKFSRHFFFAYGRKKECGCPYGLAEKKKENRKRLRLIYRGVKGLTKEGVWVIVNFRGTARQNYAIKIGLRTKN
jgi:hypothetical protein